MKPNLLKTKSPLDPIELSFEALDSDSTSQVISILCTLDKNIAEDELREKLEQIAPKFAKLYQTLKSPNWINYPDFNIQNNLQFVELPHNQNIATYAAKIYSQPLDPNLPPWRIIVLSGKEHAIHFIIHHSLCDGMGLTELIKAFTEEKPIIKKNKLAKHRDKNIRLKVLKQIITDFLNKKCSSPINGKNSNIRKYNFLNIPLYEINSARKYYQSSYYEHMVALTIDTLESYFKLHNYSTCSVNVLTPISHREPKSDSTLGNYITGMSTKFKLNQDSEELILEQVKSKLRNSMNQNKDLIYIYLAKKVAKIPRFLRNFLSNFSATRTHLICSSVPSSKEQLEILGAKIIENYGTVALMKGHGISFAFSRYYDKMCICLVSDPNIVSDPEVIIKLIQEAHHKFSKSHPGASLSGAANA